MEVGEKHDGVEDVYKRQESAQPAGLSCMAELSGLLHDMGKATKDLFQPYLLSGDRSLRGSINHASYGAQYLCRRTEGALEPHCLLAVRMMAAAIVCHHRRLMDCLLYTSIFYAKKKLIF